MAETSSQWQAYTEKYAQLSQREQILILLTGLVLSFILLFNFWLESNLETIKDSQFKNTQFVSKNQSMNNSIGLLEAALRVDPNVPVQQKITQYQQKLAKVDGELLALTSALIDPLQMRFALMELLKVKKGVAILSFELIGAEPLLMPTRQTENTPSVNEPTHASQASAQTAAKQVQILVGNGETPSALGLYRHGIKLRLKGNYFALRDYLLQLEALSWQFFWQDFHYKLLEYPNSELVIEIYSLSTKREFIGV